MTSESALADCTTLADMISNSGLEDLSWLILATNGFGAKGMQALAAGLAYGALPSLRTLSLDRNSIGNAGAAALASALGRGALPVLEQLSLSSNRIGNAKLGVLAAPLRQHRSLKKLALGVNRIGDDDVAALVACNKTAWPALEELCLDINQITDTGCATLTAALHNGVMPKLWCLKYRGYPRTEHALEGNPVSSEAVSALEEATAIRLHEAAEMAAAMLQNI